MSLLQPCSHTDTGLVHAALQAPLRPSPRQARISPSYCNRSSFSLAKRRWHGIGIEPSVHMCTANNDQAHTGRGGTSQVDILFAVFSLGLDFFYANFLPSILVSAVALGLMYPSFGQKLYQVGLSKWATFGVFLISGLTLRTSEVGNVLQAWSSLLFGVISSLVVTPWIAVLVLQFPIIPKEFLTGLALFCCMPTTLSSGVTLTQVAGANTALALALTLLSNLLGIVMIPFLISKLVAPKLGILVPAGPLVKSLVETSLAPLVIGKVIRVYASGLIDRKKKELAILSSFFLGLVPWMQVSCAKDLFVSLKMQDVAAVAVLGLATHCAFLLWTILGIHTLQGCTRESRSPYQRKFNAWAIILTASQKTLPIAIAVIGSLGGSMGESGLLVLPCLITHISQIIFDSFLVRFWVQGDLQKSSRTVQ